MIDAISGKVIKGYGVDDFIDLEDESNGDFEAYIQELIDYEQGRVE